MGQMTQVRSGRPFELNGILAGTRGYGVRHRLGSLLEYLLEKACCLDHLNRLYANLPDTHDDKDFLKSVLDLFNIKYSVTDGGAERIPREGGLIIVANHPYGAIEGVIIAAMLRDLRDDVKILANGLLQRIPEISDLFISVDVFGGQGATQRNMSPLKDAMRWVEQGGVLVVFPAGEVAHLDLRSRAVTDPPWHTSIGRIVRRTDAPVLPVFFEGRNGAMFQLAGLLHPHLRTALLPREMINKSGKTLRVRVGAVISEKRLRRFRKDAVAITGYLRLRTEMLRHGQKELSGAPKKNIQTEMPWQPVAGGELPDIMAAEVSVLPDTQCLVESGEFAVYYAESQQIPRLLNEIGRLREATFRASGEGTGKPLDIDLFDSYYIHLFVWDSKHSKLVGAYRLGRSDEILERFGKNGLYTHSLFRYRRKLLDVLGPSLELGRSFVRKEYQRSFAPLMLLWKGIGQYVVRYPRYKVLFGPVSISNDYQDHSQQLLVEFLRASHSLPVLGTLVKPRQPFRQQKHLKKLCQDAARQSMDVDDVSELVAQFEPDGKGVPVLIKQYLKLGGHLLAFNVDKDFNNAIDGLIMVDLSKTDVRVLRRYMGEAADDFLSVHEVTAA